MLYTINLSPLLFTKKSFFRLIIIRDVKFASGLKNLTSLIIVAVPAAKTLDSNCLQLPGNLGSLVGKTLLQNCKGRGFESHPSNMPMIFFHRTRESTEYTVLTHIGVLANTYFELLPIVSTALKAQRKGLSRQAKK